MKIFNVWKIINKHDYPLKQGYSCIYQQHIFDEIKGMIIYFKGGLYLWDRATSLCDVAHELLQRKAWINLYK